MLIGILFALNAQSRYKESVLTYNYDSEKLKYAKSVITRNTYYEYRRTPSQDSLEQRAYELRGQVIGECVLGVRRLLGIGRTQIKGIAKYIPTNSDEPSIGAVIKTSESVYGHIGVILSFTESRIVVAESNYKGDERFGIREISRQNPKIEGYLVLNP